MLKKEKNHVFRWIRNLYSIRADDQIDLEIHQKIILLNILYALGLPMLIYFSIFNLVKNNLGQGIMELCGIILIVFAFFYMRKTQNYVMAAYLSTTFLMVIFIVLFITGGNFGSGHLWSFIVPLSLLFIFGMKRGSILTLIYLFLVILLSLVPVSLFNHKKYDFNFFIRFLGSFLIVYCITFFFEFIRTRTNQTIRDKNIALEKTILEIKEKEKVLRESEKRFRELVDLLPQPIFEADLQGKIRYLSRSGYELSGYLKDDFGDDFDSLLMFFPEDKKRLLENTRKILKRKKLGGIEYTIRKKDGDPLPVIIHSAPIVKDKKIVGTRGVIIDITKQKQAEIDKKNLEDRLTQAEKMKAVGELAGGVAHDLNNVLGAIVGYPDVLLMNLPSDSPMLKPIQTIKKSGLKAAAIVQDLLTLARRGVQIEEVINFNKIITDYFKSPEFEKLRSFHPKIQIITNLDPGLYNMRGSPFHLTKTVMNLVSNAAESMPVGGCITVSTGNKYVDTPIPGYEGVIPEGEYIVLKISDEGMGIETDAIKKIFEPFFSKKAMGRSGTGLGMAVIWGTVMDHRGNLTVSSTPNQGTSFELYFPIARGKNPPGKMKFDLNAVKGKGEKILVVDDVEEQREIASSLLSELGYSVETASSGQEAIKLLTSTRIDLVILDMIMPPGMDGLKTYKKMIEIKPGIKTIITSGYSETAKVKEAQKLGAGIYLKKPYTIDGIGMAVKKEVKKK